jgi:hypothetical protein
MGLLGFGAVGLGWVGIELHAGLRQANGCVSAHQRNMPGNHTLPG